MSDRIPDTPPIILPLPNNTDGPLWSVMIPTYNCMQFLKDTIESVLEQDLGPEKMQIEVVDDKSTDGDVGALVQSVGKGRVSFYQQKINRGSLRNFETCINRSKGKLVHLLHGDDKVKNGFYAEIESLFNQFPEAGAAFTKYTHIDENGREVEPDDFRLRDDPGILKDFLLTVSRGAYIQPPAMVVKRSVYEEVGSFFAVHYGEDWEMWIRIASKFEIAYSPRCLALYRMGHSSNITSRSILSGQNIKDITRVINIAQDYLPDNVKAGIKRDALRSFSMHYAKAANRMYPLQKEAAFAQAKGALQMDVNSRTIYWMVRLYFKHISTMLGLVK
ncbi:family 2 glycosyl transferase [Mucilaginibacter hurinus]|uniref:Family 2 glycosyl transferase n=1 Tax=Mucilaginibacter hurinus TaxID=2201324 RepID=A0A367GLE9_9SPHI|nr:glycosyltransferase [Mucilaginibacter hurinus]RCH53676.1 family 2 glycosyl transferase [Mucilaginibacter hurinus]